MRRWQVVALVAVIVPIAALTLLPGSPFPYRLLADLLAPWIGPQMLAMVLNVALFLPLGIIIGCLRRPRWLLGAVAASVAIELAQVVIPDRNPLLSDVVANSLGACLGYVLVVVVHRIRQRRRARVEQLQR